MTSNLYELLGIFHIHTTNIIDYVAENKLTALLVSQVTNNIECRDRPSQVLRKFI